jgi:hypothetical protein
MYGWGAAITAGYKARNASDIFALFIASSDDGANGWLLSFKSIFCQIK